MSRQRVTVFLDWQNVYMHAREAFHERGGSHVDGQVDPVDLALTLAERAPEGIERELTAVRIYRGLPDQKYDEKGYAAARRQISAWQKDARVVVTTRLLRYPENFDLRTSDRSQIREKGIDVSLALDVAAMAADGHYDVGVLMSCDQDLAPALERVALRRQTRGEGPINEVAAWRSPFRRSPRLSISRGKPFCHWLDQETYWGLQDTRDYGRPSPVDVMPRRAGPPPAIAAGPAPT